MDAELNADATATLLASTWKTCKLRTMRTSRWISDMYEDCAIQFRIDGKPTQWRIKYRIGEEKDHKIEGGLLPPFDSTAVFVCRRDNTDEIASEIPTYAILKIWMQIPDRGSNQGETVAISKAPEHVKAEIDALRRMRQLGDDAPGPKLIAHKYRKQKEDQWIPGGYVCFALMQKLPGRMLDYDYYWSLTLEDRELIRKAFRAAWQKVANDLQLRHGDAALRNLMWEEENRKLYIIDYEASIRMPENSCSIFKPHLYKQWGLVRRTEDGGEEW